MPKDTSDGPLGHRKGKKTGPLPVSTPDPTQDRPRAKLYARKSTGGSRPRPFVQVPALPVRKSQPPPTLDARPPMANTARTVTIAPSLGPEDNSAEGGPGGSGPGSVPRRRPTGKCQLCALDNINCTSFNAKATSTACDQCRKRHRGCSNALPRGRHTAIAAEVTRRKGRGSRAEGGRGGRRPRPAPGTNAPSAHTQRERSPPPPPAPGTINAPARTQRPPTHGDFEPFVKAIIGGLEGLIKKSVKAELEKWERERTRSRP
ncbi:hypothetical protein CONPUDRAFT_72976 [Coniophora puteana RWD-64-598 SS2]|uniref:Zn(2)-C6 fungal-type domain-containing protein n=1 Tax=Coniophora puteana (strain RWD-64-598) TaxID=741705 RepID=A0A5M3MPX3_CONPW|nr:uncharacterized protein CONPUDRAFT_72976 [Coniophora puteana RWD-64-598 SS2]EIW81183.1 hypothetical protein CONPUDRAFT_72976 [Coniophora puteana RWD-64-598 SS2]